MPLHLSTDVDQDFQAFKTPPVGTRSGRGDNLHFERMALVGPYSLFSCSLPGVNTICSQKRQDAVTTCDLMY